MVGKRERKKLLGVAVCWVLLHDCEGVVSHVLFDTLEDPGH